MNSGLRYIALIMLVPLVFAHATAWQDSVIAQFEDTSNQYRQRWAFRTIAELSFRKPFVNTTVKSEFNTSEVKAAFVTFVESITINKPDPLPQNFKPCGYLGTDGDDLDVEGKIELPQILSLCVSWDIGGNIFTIADSLYIGYDNLYPFYSFVWNQMDTSYFNHVLTRTQTDSNFLNGVKIAEAYLLYCKEPKETMKKTALNILEAGAFSPYFEIRRWTSFGIVKIYAAGYTSLFSSVDTLLRDSRLPVRSNIHYDISEFQRRDNNLMEFDLSGDE